MLIVPANVFKNITIENRSFQDLSHGIIYFSVAQNFLDFVVFTCLSDHGKSLKEKVST